MSSQANSLKEISECLACGKSDGLTMLLDLGVQPPANTFKKSKSEHIEKYPLAIRSCKYCNHVQLTHVVDPKILYTKYDYVSGTSLTMHKYFDWFARYSLDTMTLMGNHVADDAKILDIGCNDGSQLDAYKRLNQRLQTHGIDPAKNIAIATGAKHRVKVGFFDDDYVAEVSRSIHTSDFDIITAQNVFAHNPNPVGFLNNAAKLLSDSGLLFVQTSQADMIKNGEFDTIYHEHVSYFCIRSMHELSKRSDLYLVDVTKSPLHGNSYIFIFTKDKKKYSDNRISNAIIMEESNGYSGKVALEEYPKKCTKIIEEAKKHPKNGMVVGYGAAAKAMTFLNVTGLQPEMILDDNPLKWEKYTAASNIPIVDPDKALLMIPDASTFLILAWNFFDEIKEKIKKKRPIAGDTFIRFYKNEQ